ncbi:hypothetical protein A2291_05060 [candidate division WOR-1 bacterium RIFOXYB2_FULL_42_35]|uniref:Uncharacterized protein n=1 Tax=candidate division WOR-1 bacterium RIFOXYC2_FULL_41_25 TaxID=1802586 RepID=A0A1F4TNA4_UNCSA|nr:MAG: hypothetical protein A2247_00480 [candidate division WOR-1 bacterium RIFOXYA2_FULL_41_14]OGC24470.1 MAG: hypothetical protein A2291_05060 [candidate division WOR-1 bacterium RIFOXYB2_FULL_42_35]OGC34087.1 MAG: hypothetical protein A2462_00920 [candidate division WOR-1 bacterium RIFOXYC2_FULL_41_25]OGC43088.1 MAG: hypothetical protein A2548_03145 [candidate division WOR-1 bacterium RIFOXYD2_FULL_41_8]
MKKVLLVVLALAVIFSVSAQAMIIGVEGTSPYMRFNLSNDQAIDVGATYDSNNNAATTDLQIWARINNKIANFGGISTSWGATLSLRSDTGFTAAGATTTVGLAGLVSASYEIIKNVALYANINLVTLQMMSGATTGTSFDFLTANNNVYSGARIYLPY